MFHSVVPRWFRIVARASRTAGGRRPCSPPLTGIDPRTVRPIASVRTLTLPLLFIHGTADDLVPYQDSVDLHGAAASADKTLWLVPGAGHTTAYTAQPDAYLRRVLNFLDRTL